MIFRPYQQLSDFIWIISKRKQTKTFGNEKFLNININHFLIQRFICLKHVSAQRVIGSFILYCETRWTNKEENLILFFRCFNKQEMSNTIQTDNSFVKLLAFLMVIYSVQLCESRIAELFFEEEDLPAVAASNHLPSARVDENICHLEFTVMKRAVGHCIKLGKSTVACVSGTSVHPFHPDCL